MRRQRLEQALSLTRAEERAYAAGGGEDSVPAEILEVCGPAFDELERLETGLERRRVELRADPRHRLPNPVLYRRAEALACWHRIKADVLLVEGTDSDIAARHAGFSEESWPAGERSSAFSPKKG